MDYKQINALSTEIRLIIDTSRALNIAALNATLVARRAGDVRGFHAVAAELCRFSQRLGQDMEEMSRHIFMMAMEVSALYKNGHRFRQLTVAREMTLSSTLLEGAIANCTKKQSSAADDIQLILHAIKVGINSAIRMCNSGRALARSAMIEASYSTAMAQILTMVANSLENSINSIHEWLKNMDSRVSHV